MVLNDQQQAAFEAVRSGRNIFLTGPAGSGKSYLIRHIVEWAQSANRKISVTAMTGCAALLLGCKAKTVHSWASIGLGRGDVNELFNTINGKAYLKRRWTQTNILIVDEISMMTPELFDKLDDLGKRLRKSMKPWGGIQLILCGDFFQLPPVNKGMAGDVLVGRFAFESAAWNKANLLPVLLTKIERQLDDSFQTVLNECRVGKPSEKTIEILKGRQGQDWKSKIIRPTLLFSRNADVDSINDKNIAALEKPLHVFDAKTIVGPNSEHPDADVPTCEVLDRLVQRLDNDANYNIRLELCVGCQVMLIHNVDVDAGLVNGSRGVVLDFDPCNLPIVQFMRGGPVVVGLHQWDCADSPCVHRTQIPLRVAYAITIHKSQGATLDCALVDIGSSTFEYGQAYVALSRVRDIESLYVWNLNPQKIRAHPTVQTFYEGLSAPPKPVVGLCTEVGGGWQPIVTGWAAVTMCLDEVAARSKEAIVYPESSNRLNALIQTPLESVKVVILGQDPYHGPGQAHGLSFSVLSDTALPPSLRNIRKEFLADGGSEEAWPVTQGNLTAWAKQGVLLLNAVLTVEEGKPNSHAGLGWEDLTTRLLSAVIAAHADDPLVFLAWGKFAQGVIGKLTMGAKHKVLSSAHPSPLSAHTGFFGSAPFTGTNAHLIEQGAAPINWALAT